MNKVVIIIKDVVCEVWVFVVMVLCVLNGYENVVEFVCKLVLEVVVCLCYILYVVVCSLSSWCINIIGVVLFDLYGEFFFELMCGIDNVVCVCC